MGYYILGIDFRSYFSHFAGKVSDVESIEKRKIDYLLTDAPAPVGAVVHAHGDSHVFGGVRVLHGRWHHRIHEVGHGDGGLLDIVVEAAECIYLRQQRTYNLPFRLYGRLHAEFVFLKLVIMFHSVVKAFFERKWFLCRGLFCGTFLWREVVLHLALFGRKGLLGGGRQRHKSKHQGYYFCFHDIWFVAVIVVAVILFSLFLLLLLLLLLLLFILRVYWPC